MKNIIILLFLLLPFACSKQDRRIVKLNEALYLCDSYEPESAQFQSDAILNISIKPIVYIYNNKEFYNINFEKIQESLNSKYELCNIKFKMEVPTYIIIINEYISFRTNLDRDFKLGELRMAIYPKGVKFIEETVGTIQGAANGIPTLANTSTGRPIFFIRYEKMYTDVVNHELGHVFGLFHTFKSGENTCDTGDKVIDTIAPPDDLAIFVETCEGDSKSISSYSKDEIDNFISNPMSYSPNECMTDFTIGQCQRMRKMIEVNLALQAAIYKVEYANF